MKLDDLEDIVAKVALDLFNYKHPDFNAIENAKTLQTCIDDSAFVINKFISYFNSIAESEGK